MREADGLRFPGSEARRPPIPSLAQRGFDYAEWRRRHFADIDIEHDKANPLGAALP